MKLSCEIIKDLLPLYHDNVCSSESRVLVEEHIQECDSCKKQLRDISDELACPVNTTDEAKPIKAIQTVWRKDKKKSFIKGALVTIIILAVLGAGFFELTQNEIVPVSTDLLEVSEVCQLADGRIVFNLMVEDDKELTSFKYTTNNEGVLYITPLRSIIESKRISPFGLNIRYLDVDLTERNLVGLEPGQGVSITSLYIGTQDDRILIWEEGMDLPVANIYIEDMFNVN